MSGPSRRGDYRRRLNEMVRAVRSEIILGRRKPGDFLPSEQALARQYGLSNISVRKGLELLVKEGFIAKIPRVGNQVVETYTDRSVNIKFGYHADLEETIRLSLLLAEFRRLHPHIHVQAVPLQFANYRDTIKEYMENGLLDVVTVNYPDFRSFAPEEASGLFFEQEDNPSVYRLLNRLFMSGGRLLAAPFAFSPLVLCYNRSHFREKRLPEPDSSWTWDDLADNARRLAVKDARYGFYLHLASFNRWPVFLLQNDVGLDRSEPRSFEASIDRIVEALRVCRDILHRPDSFPSFFAGADGTPEELFAQGKISMIVTTYFYLNYLSAARVDYDLAPLPYLREAKTLLLAIGIAVNRYSARREAAQSLADYLVSGAAQALIRRETLSLPAVKLPPEPDDSALSRDPVRGDRPSRYGVYRETIPTYGVYTDINLEQRDLQLILSAARLYWSNIEGEQALRERLVNALR